MAAERLPHEEPLISNGRVASSRGCVAAAFMLFQQPCSRGGGTFIFLLKAPSPDTVLIRIADTSGRERAHSCLDSMGAVDPNVVVLELESGRCQPVTALMWCSVLLFAIH